MRNIAAVMTDIRTFEFQERPMPKVSAGEVGIAVKDVGICGSDMHFLTATRKRSFRTRFLLSSAMSAAA
jgi:L-iditol 2-dehydrogenase